MTCIQGPIHKQHTRAMSRLLKRREISATPKKVVPEVRKRSNDVEGGQDGTSSKGKIQGLQKGRRWRLESSQLTPVHMWKLRVSTMVSLRRAVGAVRGSAESRDLWLNWNMDGSKIMVPQGGLTQIFFLFFLSTYTNDS